MNLYDDMSDELLLKKKTVDDWLDEVDYGAINRGFYQPTVFALKMMNFIKLVNGVDGESHKTPVVHLMMLDKIAGSSERIANLCARGIAKTTLMYEYLALYIGVFHEIDGFGPVDSMIYVSDSMENGVKSARKNIEHRYENSDFLKEWIPTAYFTDPYLEFTNKSGQKTGIKMFGAKTGMRGTKIFGKRPVLAVLDDLVGDDDATSKAKMQAIKDTIGKGVEYALDPTRRKIIFNGTPFNKSDILYEAVESGAWDVNVWPICEKFPVDEKDFNGAWEDRFTYDFVKGQYEMSVRSGKLADFNQELMLRISSDEERLVSDMEIQKMWYPRTTLLQHKQMYNFYITTDFATSSNDVNDFSVISVWAYNNHGDWFWVDGMMAKQTMDKNIDRLFHLVSEYHPQSVGIEISGQQGAFISWLQNEMMERNIWFNFAQEKGRPGISPTMNKFSRFNLVLPLIKAGKIHFPEELKDSVIIGEFTQELELATVTGLKSKHDDAIDTISMLMYMKPFRPSEQPAMSQNEDGMWELDEYWKQEQGSSLNSYIV